MIGAGAPGAELCAAAHAYDCGEMRSVPSGPDPGRPTRILGYGHELGCANAPRLWGTERVASVLNLQGSSNVEVSCLELTDKEACIEMQQASVGGQMVRGPVACKREESPPPWGRWASNGVKARDSSNVVLRDLNIHGLAHAGIYAARLKDWTLERVRIAGNGWAGWHGDLGTTTSSNSGLIRMSRVTVEWNGCAEGYPDTQSHAGCWSGYGDGLGTARTGGEWRIEDSLFRWNTSDGIDLLYTVGGKISIERNWVEGNAGNQIKTRGPALIRNNVVVGNCRFFEGKPFTWRVDHCRAMGDSVVPVIGGPSEVAAVTNNTVISQGNCTVVADAKSPDNGPVPHGGTFELLNNVLIGGVAPQATSNACYLYTQGPMTVVHKNNTLHNVRNYACGQHALDGVVCADPQVHDIEWASFDPRLRASSSARRSGLSVGTHRSIPGDDFHKRPRPPQAVDRGALQNP